MSLSIIISIVNTYINGEVLVLVALKQLRHLVSREPHGFIGKPNLSLRLATLRLE